MRTIRPRPADFTVGAVTGLPWPRRASVLLAGLVSVAALSLSPLSAAAKTAACGAEQAQSQGAVFMIRATAVSCTTAKRVAGGYYHVQSGGRSGRTIVDPQGRRWTCRVTKRATGTDPGYEPYTSVRCSRVHSELRFKLRS
jgi:streptogramin lyase